jgi:hypothetical protein
VIAPELMMVATSAVGRGFREINPRTQVGARWSDEAWREAMVLEKVRPNGTGLESYT